MEQNGKTAAAIDRAPSVSIRAPERRVPSEYPPVEPPHGWSFGRYELLGRIAYGGMAEIYLARESAYGLAVRYVVIKRVLPHIATDQEFVGLFMDEARVAMSLTHPHISHIYEFGRIEGSYFLAMEWVNGVTLNKIIKRAIDVGRPLPTRFAAKVISGVAEALDYAHAVRDEKGKPLGIVHRDVTPHNIMLTFDGSAKLLDFGIAMAASRNTDTRTGLVRGKLAYMSPQQCLARGIDGRSDIFSLGVCLFEAITGKRLYRRETDFEVCEAILKGPVPSIRDIDPSLPEELDDVVQRCLAKDPADRFQRAGEVQASLQRYLAERRESVTAAEMGELMRDLFPVLYRNGPPLDTKTDLLNGLPRLDASAKTLTASLAPRIASVPAPTLNLQSPAVSQEPEEDTVTSDREATGSVTRTVSSPVGRSAFNFLLVAVIAVMALAGYSIWSLASRPAQVVVRSAPQPAGAAMSTREVPKQQAPVAVEVEKTDNALQGSLWISSEPAGARIYINGNPTGQETPTQLTGIWPGAYRITLRKSGYDEYRTRVQVDAARVTQTSAELMTRAEAREFYRRRAEEQQAEKGEAAALETAEPSPGEPYDAPVTRSPEAAAGTGLDLEEQIQQP